MLTLQEIFDKSCSAIIAQGVQCKERLGCKYAGPNNTACAVGVLLPREMAEEWTRDGVGSIATLDTAERLEQLHEAGIPTDPTAISLLAQLQWTHDRWTTGQGVDFVTSFKQHARDTAIDFGLSTAVLEGVAT